ncbi:MAG: carbon-nitrogen hydrolase [Spirochaetales bacterium]|nr:carbon-nitrogen hydrolase [Leptospiraceae bacterium]MCP5482467.1 carbon-nitrogen hydrolase [Spirochaetales bacterium]MCP5485829.1 carbon-nitrogen hydrolase [Spirochaetales bacterium]
MRVALIQSTASADPERNRSRTLERIREAAAGGARVVCTQELYASRYFCQSEESANFDLAESIPGPTTEALGALAAELSIVIIASLFERRLAGLYHNTAVVIDADGSLMGSYRKMHIPDDPGYYEKYYFSPGDLGFRVWDTRHGRLAVLICWDQWFPEAARAAALAGAEVLFYPTAIGWQDDEREALGDAQHDAWETVQRGHAIANGVFVCATNRVGREDGITFFGRSFVCDPFGRVLYRAGEAEEIVFSNLDLRLVEETRRAWPFLRDRRVESYEGLQKKALV